MRYTQLEKMEIIHLVGAVRDAGETDAGAGGVTGRRLAPDLPLDAGKPAASVQGRWDTSIISTTLHPGPLH